MKIYFCLENFWRAPERLINRELEATREADIYSYAIILYEISVRADPYFIETADMSMTPRGQNSLLMNMYPACKQ